MASIVGPAANAQEPAGPKQVLVLNSTKQNEQFYLISEREIPKLLGEGLGAQVEYYTEYFDVNRFPHPQYETVYLDFLRQKYAGRHFDLLLLMGDDAMDFMCRHRSELFSGTPVVFYSLNPPDNPIANSTGLLNKLHFGPSIDLALALQPDLKHVYVVSGATAGDREFEEQARAEFQPFEKRVDFTYWSGLVTQDLEQRLAALPPRSAVYYVVVNEDGAGEHFQQMAYLSRVAGAANAPTYSWADVGVDAGIVGGRRRDQLAQMKAIATLSLRILRGERADEIPVSMPNTDSDAIDWRQLSRWGLDESRLPKGTRVLLRPPSMWDQYRDYVISALILIFGQTALIVSLLVQRAKRRRAEGQLHTSQYELHNTEATLRVSYDQIRHLSRRLLHEQEAERGRIARELHDDINQQVSTMLMDLYLVRGDRLHSQSTKSLSRAMETARSILASVRELSHRLHPSKLHLMGLVASLESLRGDLSAAHLSVAFFHRDVPTLIDQDIALCLFRVAQEALGNAVKHSEARHISIDLSGGSSSLRLTITDDGRGFDVETVPNAGLGLISMRERVESVGGVLEIHSTPASGTRLTVTVPTPLSDPTLAPA